MPSDLGDCLAWGYDKFDVYDHIVSMTLPSLGIYKQTSKDLTFSGSSVNAHYKRFPSLLKVKNIF